jgi:hypothetical protein
VSSRGIEPLVEKFHFFYRETPLPIGSPAQREKGENKKKRIKILLLS